MRSVIVGFGMGALVAVQVGPMSLFLIRSTLRAGLRVGLAIAAGIALVDTAYAALGAAGAAPLLGIDSLRVVLGLVGAAVLARIGYRTLQSAFRVRSGLEIPPDVANPRRAFMTSLAATASNPSTIVSWAAIFAASSTAADTVAVPLVVGVWLGSLTWVVALATVVSIVRRTLGERAFRTADAFAGAGLLGFAGVLGYRTVRSLR